MTRVVVDTDVVSFLFNSAGAWIAATALLYDLPLITHNRNDYLGVPRLRLVSHGA